MNRARLLDRIGDALAAAAKHGGMAEMMAAQEREDGAVVVPVGASEPFAFPAADWVENSVVSVRGGEVRLVAILAQHPARGALRRLCQAIREAGLRPVIIAPVGSAMPAILKHWGWRCTMRGRGYERVDEWRPADGMGPGSLPPPSGGE